MSRAIESVLAQTFGDFELVVVDDGSTDGSAAIVESFAERDPRVRLVRTAHGGVRSARSVSLTEARAPFVAFLDADDEWLPAAAGAAAPLRRRANGRVRGLVHRRWATGRTERRYSDLCSRAGAAVSRGGLFPSSAGPGLLRPQHHGARAARASARCRGVSLRGAARLCRSDEHGVRTSRCGCSSRCAE